MSDDGAYDLVPLPEPIRLRIPGRVVLRDNIFTLVDAIAGDVFERSLDATATHGTFHLGLSLTPVVEQVLRQLLLDHSLKAMPWDRTHVWVTDDAPPAEGEESPLEGFAEFLRDHAGMPLEHVHLPPVSAGDAAHERYAIELSERLRAKPEGQGFDFALMTVNGQGVVGVAEPDTPHTGLTHRVRKGELAWTSVHAPVFRASERVALVVPDGEGFSFVKRLEVDSSGAGVRHVRPASQDGMTWYVNVESGETDGRPGRGANRSGKEEDRP